MKNSWVLVAILAVAGCAAQKASAPAPATAAAPAAPQAPAGQQPPAQPAIDVKAMLARELQPLAKQKFQFADAGLSGEVEATAAPQLTKQDKLSIIEIPVGTQAGIQCFIYPEPIDAGGAIARLLAGSAQNVDLQEVKTAAIPVVKEMPVVFVQAIYLDKQSHSLIGEVKIASYADPSTPIVCVHDEPGYGESFQRIVQGFLGSLKRTGATRPASKMVEIHVTAIDGHPIGFEKRELVEAKKGETVHETVSCLLLPRSAKELIAQDSIDRQTVDAKRRVTEVRHTKAIGGEVKTDLEAKRQGASYAFKGKVDGKDVSGTFTPTDRAGLPGAQLIAQWLRERLLSGKVKQLKIEEYHPSMDAEKPVEVVYDHTGTGREVEMTAGKARIKAILDEQGLIEKVEAPMGPSTFTSTRVLLRGKP